MTNAYLALLAFSILHGFNQAGPQGIPLNNPGFADSASGKAQYQYEASVEATRTLMAIAAPSQSTKPKAARAKTRAKNPKPCERQTAENHDADLIPPSVKGRDQRPKEPAQKQKQPCHPKKTA
jgi:outer membrane biosynthesis protein TonB